MKSMSIFVLGLFVFSIISCSTHRANISYTEFKEMPLKEGTLNGKNLGRVSGEEGGAIWNDCTEKARSSVLDLIANAKAMGATAIGEVKWHATGTSSPGCRKSWGYFAIWPFVLTPLFMSTRVDGTAYQGGSTAGRYPLPNHPDEEEALVNQILAASR